MIGDRMLRWLATAYARLLVVLARRDRRERQLMARDGAQILAEAHAGGPGLLARTWFALLWDLLFVGVRHDLAQAVRAVVRAPAMTVGVSLLLGIGVAATTTLFAFVDAVLLRPLPYEEPDRLVRLFESNLSQDRLREGGSPGNILDWVARSDAFEAMTAAMPVSATLRGRDGGAPISGVHVTHGFFDVYRRRPLLGRTFEADEFEGAASITSRQPSRGEPVVVLSHRLWRMLGADPGLIGQAISIEGVQWRVIGVMPSDFAAPDATADFWAPWDMRVSYRGARFPQGPPRDARFLHVTGRLHARMSIDGASARMQTLASALEAEHPDVNTGWTLRLTPLAEEIARTSRMELLLVFAAMSCLLLLLCANVTSLAVARRLSSDLSLRFRRMLGAGTGRLTRQLVAESGVSAVLTTLVALVLTAWWVDAAVAAAPAGIARLNEVGLHPRVASFAALLALVVTAVGQAVPTLRASRSHIASTLKDGVAVSARASGRWRGGLVVAEIAAAVMLLVGAGLLVRTFAELQRVDVGFDTRNLLVLRIAPDAARYRTGADTSEYYRRVLASVREVPAIQSVAAVTSLPMSTLGSEFTRPYWLGATKPEGSAAAEASIRMATPGYFATLGRPLAAGREFTARDDADAPRVLIINEKLARSTWGSENPVGRQLTLDYQRGAYPYEVVGVVRDDRHDGPRSEPVPEIFIPHAQNPYLVLNVIARTSIDPWAVAQTARTHASRVDPDQPVHSVTTMEHLLGDALQLDRFSMLLVSWFAVGGLLTAAGGVYALLAYGVAERRREIALRMALGASPQRVARSVVTESLALAVAGGTVGLVCAAAASRFIHNLLFRVAPQDPTTILTAVAVLLVVVAAASWLPARRAALTDPVRAMKI